MTPFKDKSLTTEVDNIMALLLENDRITKLLYHDTEDALSKPSLTVAQKRELVGKKIFKRKNLKVLTNESGSFLSYRLNHFRPSQNNQNTIMHTVDFYIVCHEGTIDTKDGQRDLLIVEALSAMLYLQNSIGASKPQLNVIEDLVFDSNDFSGYLVSFHITAETLNE